MWFCLYDWSSAQIMHCVWCVLLWVMAQAFSHGHEILLNMEQFLKEGVECGSRKKKVQERLPQAGVTFSTVHK